MTDKEKCAHCGMAVADGDNPTTREGETYCCGGCASGIDCTCSGHQHEESAPH